MANEERTTDTGTAYTPASAAQALLAVDYDDNLEGDEAQEELEQEPEAEAEDTASESEESEADDEAAEDDEGESEDDEDVEQDEEEPEPRYRVKVDGEELEVTLDELRNGYSRTQDYSRKTQALAEQRKAAEQEAERVRQERAQYAQGLQALDKQLRSMVEQEPDWDRLYREDPVEYVKRQADWQKQQQQLQAVQEEQKRIYQQQQEEQQKQLQQTLREEQKRLAELIPEWSDPKVAQTERQKIRQAATEYGYSQEELGSIYDARAVAVLRDAIKYRELRKGKQKLRPTAKSKGPKTATPGATSTPKEQRRASKNRTVDRFVKSGGTPRQAAAAIANLLDD